MDYFGLLNLTGTGTLASQNGGRGHQDFHALYSAQCD
jgi:hypothetical protein